MTAKRRSTVSGKRSKKPTKSDLAPSKTVAIISDIEIPTEYQEESGISVIAPEELILKELRFIERLKGISCLPEEDWPKSSIPLLRKHLDKQLTVVDVTNTLEMYRASMLVHRMRLTRAVQPIGTPHFLAPIIGSIRLNDIGIDHAVQYLLNHILMSVRSADKFTFPLLQEFSKAPLGRHRNFVVWQAIEEMMNNNAEAFSSSCGPEQLTISLIPWSGHVKEYVGEQQKSNRYSNLPKDGKGWTRLWEESGAEMIIAKSTTRTFYKTVSESLL